MSCAKGRAFYDCSGARQNIKFCVLVGGGMRSCSGSTSRPDQSSLFLTLILHYNSHTYLFDRAHVKSFHTIYLRMFTILGYAHAGHPRFAIIIQNVVKLKSYKISLFLLCVLVKR